ncbi:hypothetical protein [Pseudomonas coronafaciens]|uniref:Uncharacterized protein n=1 Tax=Pseudomonas coronafaciens pv. coronafaciens TaxID=235275 RepID=A0AAE6UP01_9PSED|nr:hypothetical protein [Pseudomonas coronafaciens]QGT83980.1 hypothetical protein GMO17_23940 [Pseudomonas coronafaciens pv. coronafaciens]QIQ71816.1 hypothetical protein HBB04_02207 [Pseudomonas coronafaciens]
MSNSDPVNAKYYIPLERANLLSDLAFFAGAVLSIASLYLVKGGEPLLYNVVNISFALTVLMVFVGGLLIRFYYFPRAEGARIQDFLGHAYSIDMTPTPTDAYYNNETKLPMKKMGAQLLENSLFTKEIASRMLRGTRVRYGLYVIIWLVLILVRDVEFGFLLVASQLVFNEQVLAKWIKLEWLRYRAERTYEQIYRVFVNKLNGDKFNCSVMEYLTYYETSKVNASVQLSSRVFRKLNPALSVEWETMRKSLGI